jgi:hypothetical protein
LWCRCNEVQYFEPGWKLTRGGMSFLNIEYWD